MITQEVARGVRVGNRGLVIAMTSAVPESTASDREVHRTEFKEKLRVCYITAFMVPMSTSLNAWCLNTSSQQRKLLQAI
jgi:hypothetical protein